MGALGNDEYIIQCGINGEIIGHISKHHAHISGNRTTLCHYATWGMVYNLDLDAWGIQQKSNIKDDKLCSLKRDVSVAGHNTYFTTGPELFNETLKRESLEELEMKLMIFNDIDNFKQYSLIGNESKGYIFEQFHYSTQDNNEYIGLGIILTHQQVFTFNDGEVADFVRIKRQDIPTYILKANLAHSLLVAIEKCERIIDSVL